MLKDENTRLRVLAEHDWLTGLYNRRAAEAHVDEALLKTAAGCFWFWISTISNK